MTATYISPGASEKDSVRFLLSDTNVTNPLLSDEEIEWLLSRWKPIHGTLEYVASVAADTISARYAREASYSGDGVSISLAGLGQQYRDLAVTLRAQHKALLAGGIPDVGGVTPGEGTAPDIVPFDFGTGMHDNQEAGRQAYGNRPSPEYVAEYQPGS